MTVERLSREASSVIPRRTAARIEDPSAPLAAPKSEGEATAAAAAAFSRAVDDSSLLLGGPPGTARARASPSFLVLSSDSVRNLFVASSALRETAGVADGGELPPAATVEMAVVVERGAAIDPAVCGCDGSVVVGCSGAGCSSSVRGPLAVSRLDAGAESARLGERRVSELISYRPAAWHPHNDQTSTRALMSAFLEYRALPSSTAYW